MTEEEAPGVYDIPVTPEQEAWTTCFLVAIDRDGAAYAHADVEGFLANKEFERLATGQDMWGGAAQVKRHIEEIQLTQKFLNAQMQLARAVQQQHETQSLLTKIQTPGSNNF